MTEDLVEQLRARNPAPAPLPPPPIEDVLARIAAGERSAADRRRWTRWAGPSLAVAVAAAVAVLAVMLIHTGAHSGTQDRVAPARNPTGHTSPLIVRPVPAMRGGLEQPLIAFSSPSTGLIAWSQAKAGVHRQQPWLATTSDGGRSWTVSSRRFSLFSTPVFDGPRDGWAQAIDPHQALRFYVTHDGGRSWAAAHSAAAADSVTGDVSVAGGVVWAVGTGSCPTAGCKWVVMRGPGSGDRLPATVGQPLPPTNQNATRITAASATTAYVAAPARHGTDIYVTHDGGHRWERLGNQCAVGGTDAVLTVTGADSLWRVCAGAKRFSAARSNDGGGSWTGVRLPFVPRFNPFVFEPVTATVAWAQEDLHGTIYRTADGGASWQPVWRSSGGPHGRAIVGLSPTLSAQSANDAAVLVELTHGPSTHGRVPRSTNLVVYRTTDGGHSWHPSVVKLPRG